MMEPACNYRARTTFIVFVFAGLVAGATVAGPGLSWDEPAYRHSQVSVQDWLTRITKANSNAERALYFSKSALYEYWQFNRFGHNFHPPMASYFNLLTYGLVGGIWDDISSRRLASALEFAGAIAILCHFLGRRFGTTTGVFSAACLLFMPRLMGDAHVIGTDMPLMFFWTAVAFAFLRCSDSISWQWWTGFLCGCLFLVKFSGIVAAGPMVLWWLGLSLRRSLLATLRTLLWTMIGLIPLFPVAAATILGFGVTRGAEGPIVDLSGLEKPIVFWCCIAAEILLLCAVAVKSRQAQSLPTSPSNAEVRKDVALPYAPFAIIVSAVVTALALNPTWWHDPVTSLVDYFHLNLRRQGQLPNIGIFYLGKRYFYSLPWHNAYVLMAVTIPFGTLLMGLLGTFKALVGSLKQPLGFYLLLHMLALPIFRMFGTPGHDGVRLFLPTFVFFAALAGIGAQTIQVWLRRFGSRLVWCALFALAPVWSALDWLRIHPYELSYYNIGLARAVDAGFEATYWYDAVTPRVLADLNRQLPHDIAIGFPDPLINPDVFETLQNLDRLRGDINESVRKKGKFDGFAWAWLLTHSSKATALTRLLYACKPWYESEHAGVRLFAVVDDKSSALAFALRVLTVEREDSAQLGSLQIREIVFRMTPEELRAALKRVRELAANKNVAPRDQRDKVEELVEQWMPGGVPTPYLNMLLQYSPQSLDRAIELFSQRKADIEMILENEGYLRPEKFHGYFEP